MKKIPNLFLMIGIVGFVVVLVLNVIGLTVLNLSSAVPLQKGWWSSWLPSYLAFTAFVVIGIGTRFLK